MATTKPRFMVTITDEMRADIDNYRFTHRCKSQTQAINELIERGLDVILSDWHKKEEPAIDDGLTDEEKQFLNGVSNLTPRNRRLFLGFLALLLKDQEQGAAPPG